MIGEDGWLEDVVLSVSAPGTASASGDGATALGSPLMRERLVLLHEALFGTAFGGSVEDIDASYAATARQAAPNLAVTSSELYQWLHDPQLEWAAIDDASPRHRSFQVLLKEDSPGPFLSSDGRLVVFLVNNGLLRAAQRDRTVLDPLRAPFREFAVASDAVIGCAWQPSGRMVLVGRARSHPLAAIPPLRFETFQLLAHETRGELQQSYERNNVMAGKMFAGENQLRDWAPIYLSTSLLDTEFGALLNITDQILKSYSQAGQVDYVYFQYPLRPDTTHFLLGDQPLSEVIYRRANADTGGHQQVLFNWNTSGSAVITQYADLSLLTTRHTGSLAVTYGAELKGKKELETGGDLLGLEDQAYEYFAALKDPNLARVVSYTLIYQGLIALAKDSGETVSENGFEPVPARQAASDMLVDQTSKLLETLQRNAISPFDSRLVRVYAMLIGFEGDEAPSLKKEWQAFQHAHPQLAADRARLAQLLVTPEAIGLQILNEEPVMALRAQAFKDGETALNQKIEVYNARIEHRSTLSWQALRDLKAQAGQIETEQAALQNEEKELAAFLQRREEFNNTVPLRTVLSDVTPIALNLDEVRAAYVHANAAVPAGRIKTPSVVVSWDTAAVGSTGGHNLTARALRIEIVPDVENIDVVETPAGIVLKVNPKYAPEVGAHASDIARAVEHEGMREPSRIAALWRDVQPPRSPEQALELSQANAADSWAGLGERPKGFKAAGTDVTLADTLLSRMQTTGADAVVKRNSEGFHVASVKNSHPPPAFSCCMLMKDSVSTRQFLIEIKLQSNGKGRVVFEGESPEHVAALAHTLSGKPSGESNLNVLARAAGSGDKVGGPGEVDFLSLSNEGEEPPPYLRILALTDRAQEAALYEPRDWTRVRVNDFSGDVVQRFLADASHGTSPATAASFAAWDGARDGHPYLVELSFGELSGPDSTVANVLAGLDPQQLESGQRLIRQSVQAARQESSAASQSLLDGLARMKAFVSAQPSAGAVRRLNIIVSSDRQRFLITRRLQIGVLSRGG